jgi:hypothetical protein
MSNFTYEKQVRTFDSSVLGYSFVEYPPQVLRRIGLDKMASYSTTKPTGLLLKAFNPRVKAFALIPAVVTRHTTACVVCKSLT